MISEASGLRGLAVQRHALRGPLVERAPRQPGDHLRERAAAQPRRGRVPEVLEAEEGPDVKLRVCLHLPAHFSGLASGVRLLRAVHAVQSRTINAP